MKKMIRASKSFTLDIGDLNEYYDVYSPEDYKDFLKDTESLPDDLANDIIEEQADMLKSYGLQLAGFGNAKSKYFQKLSNNALDMITIGKNGSKLTPGYFVNDRFYMCDIDEVENCLEV